MEYYIEEIDNTDEIKWKQVLNYAIKEANVVEFNLLYEDEEWERIKSKFKNSFIGVYENRRRLYKSGKVVRFTLNDEMKDFIYKKKFNDWINYCLEDISFYKNDIEFLATISHENYLIIELGDELRQGLFKKLGFKCQTKVNR